MIRLASKLMHVIQDFASQRHGPVGEIDEPLKKSLVV
jgi:hypothetical protein